MSTWQEKRSQALKGKPPSFGSRSKGLIIEVKPRMFVLDIGVGTAHLSRTLTERLGDSSEKPVFKIGDVIDIRIANDGDPHPKPRKALLGDLPEGAMIVLDNHSRDVLAMVGGYTYHSSTLTELSKLAGNREALSNHLFGELRSRNRKFTPASIFIDGPSDSTKGEILAPEELLEALQGRDQPQKVSAFSVNSVAIQLADRVGVSKVHEFARSLGITTPLSQGLAVALGGSEVNAMELVNAYATIADQGRPQAPQFILSVDGYDNPSWQAQEASYSGIDPDVAFVLRHVMGSVISIGSAKSLRTLDREVVGKTGTTNQARDAWFRELIRRLIRCLGWVRCRQSSWWEGIRWKNGCPHRQSICRRSRNGWSCLAASS